MTEPGGGKQASTSCGASEAHVEQQLIPGLPNEITLDHITSKLPRRDIDNTLLCVSRGWCRAIRSRQVYDARVRTHSTETFVLSNHTLRVHTSGDTLVRVDNNMPADAMSLWSFTDGRTSLQLPPIASTCFDTVIPGWARCVTLDGKVYVFGGQDCKLHVLDVAGHRRWKQCANMPKPKPEFGCGVIDGKIYVFGGAVNHESMSGSEAYNPKENTWSRIRPIVSLRCGHHISRVRPELVVRGQHDFYRHHDWPCWYRLLNLLNADVLKVYDPIKDEWKEVEPVGNPKEKLFVAGGKFYSMSPLGVHVYDFHRHLWVHRHSFSFAAFARVEPVELWPLAMLTDDGELLAVSDWPTADRGTNSSCLLQSRGLRSENNEIVWQKADFSIPLGECSQLCTIYRIGRNAIKL